MAKHMPWSYTALSTFEQCPKKYYELRVAKRFKDTLSKEAELGVKIHKAVENYARGVGAYPAEVESAKPLVDRLLDTHGARLVEQKLGVTYDFKPTEFFGRDVWYRGVVDFAIIGEDKAIVVDYKTGKRRDNPDQLALMSAAIMAKYPQVQETRTMYLWLKTAEVTPQTYTRADAIWPDFVQRYARMVHAHEKGNWPARPSPLCAWCPVTDCPHWIQR